jgi:hypothetical protein
VVFKGQGVKRGGAAVEIRPTVNVIKLFFSVADGGARLFVRDEHFQLRSYLSEAQMSRLSWNGLSGTNTLIWQTEKNVFKTMSPRPNVKKLFMSAIYGFS